MKFIFSAVHYTHLVISGHCFSLRFHRNLSSQVNVNYKGKKILKKREGKREVLLGLHSILANTENLLQSRNTLEEINYFVTTAASPL